MIPPNNTQNTISLEDFGSGAAEGVAASIHAPPAQTPASAETPSLATPTSIVWEGYPSQPRTSLVGLHFNRTNKGEQIRPSPNDVLTKLARR